MLSYGRQWIASDDIVAVKEVLRSDYITCGPKIKEVEEKLKEVTGAKYCVLVNSGTSALHCACIAAGIGCGDEVITTPLTFAASANCALFCGARPVFADIDSETYEIDPQSIREHITEKTKAVVAVDYTGALVYVDEIRQICKEYNLLFIEDAAHSIGSKYNGKSVGTLADMTCMSFHPVKTVTSGEGGAVLTDDEELYQKVLLAHSHGITRDIVLMDDGGAGAFEDGDRTVAPDPWYYEMIDIGYNYRMTDIQAGLLLSQLNKLDMFARRRKEIVKRYDDAFADVPEIVLQKEYPECNSTRHLYVIQLVLEKLNCTRREFFDAMVAEGIRCQVHYIPTYWFSYYQKMGYKKGICPNAERIYSRIMSIPLYPKMTDEDVEFVIATVKKVILRERRKG